MNEPTAAPIKGDVPAIIAAATRATTPAELGGGFFSVVVPAGAQQVTIDTEALAAPYRDHPRRKKGTAVLTTPASLSQYVNTHKIVGDTEMYGDWREQRVVALLNGHSDNGDNEREGLAGWGDHRAILTLAATPEWKAWAALDGKWMDQVDFAEHITATTRDIVDPAAADLLEMAENFTATRNVNFKSGSRLRDGQRQLTYQEDINATAGSVTIPESILLRLAPFDGAEPTEIGARIRYRIGEGNLRIGYQLDRPDLVLREAFAEVVVVVESATGITALAGTPRS